MPTMTIPEARKFAGQQLMAGRLAEAESIYRQILAQAPRDSDALHLLGVIAHQSGRYEAAVDLIRQAIAVNPSIAGYHTNLSAALKESGQLDAALAAARKAVSLNPRSAEAQINLGSALRSKGEFAEAVAAWRKALEWKPGYAEVHGNLANALSDQGHWDEAIAEYRTAIQLKPGFAPARLGLGNALKSKGQLEEAIATYRAVLDLAPGYADAWYEMGNALREQGRLEEAIFAYRRATELRPDSADWRFVLDALTREGAAAAAPPSYVRGLFDGYADRFDEHLTSKLNYHVPELLRAAVLSAAPARKFDILDLGCGTGLCGVQFRSHAKTLAGVDLSPKMIEKARARGIYDHLSTGDVVEAMRDQPRRFDLIIAGDVFVYMGDLGEVFAAAAGALRGGGLFAFTVERSDHEGFTLHSDLRFAHSLAYVRGLSTTQRFDELLAREVALRTEGAREVGGWLVVLQKTAGDRGVAS